eukprot:14083263-Alexandrium_andersonii.AAC.1
MAGGRRWTRTAEAAGATAEGGEGAGEAGTARAAAGRCRPRPPCRHERHRGWGAAQPQSLEARAPRRASGSQPLQPGLLPAAGLACPRAAGRPQPAGPSRLETPGCGAAVLQPVLACLELDGLLQGARPRRCCRSAAAGCAGLRLRVGDWP